MERVSLPIISKPFASTSKCIFRENKLLRTVGLFQTKRKINMLLSLALHGMKAFIFIVGSAGKTQTTLYKMEAVTLETVKLLETFKNTTY
jgi:hypothetical protein